MCRIYLRSCLVLTTVAACFFGFLAYEIRLARHEYRAYQELQELGATGDDWVGWREIFGYPPLVQVDLSGTIQIEHAMEHLRHLENLEYLSIDGIQLTDSNLANLADLLAELTNFRWLNLSGTRLSDEEVHELQMSLPNCTITK